MAELGIARLESSPVSHTSPRSCSRIMRTVLLRRVTVKICCLFWLDWLS